MRRSHLCLGLAAAVGTGCLALQVARPSWSILPHWGLTTLVLSGLIVLAFVFEFEAQALSSKEVALVAVLGTLSAVLRIPFAAIPNVQPCTYLIICSGYVFGSVTGFMVGLLTAVLSNAVLGFGPWTLFQVLAWGLAGATASPLGRWRAGRWTLAGFGLTWGYVFGLMMNAWFWASFAYPLTWQTFLAVQAAAIWFDTLHAAGNVIFLSIFGPKTITIFERFRMRFYWTEVPEGIASSSL